MPRRRLATVAALAALALCAPATASADDCAGADLVPAADNVAVVGQATLCRLNQQRAAHGVGALAENATADHRLRGLLAADGRAGLLRPRVAGRRHARRPSDRRRLPRRRRRVGRGREHRLGPGHARDRALDGHRVDGQRRPPREPAQRRLHRRSAWALALGTPADQTWGATYTTDFGPAPGAGARRTRAPRPACRQSRKKAKRPAMCARAASRAPRRELHEAALVGRMRPLGARYDAAEHLSIALRARVLSSTVMPRALPIAALLALAVAPAHRPALPRARRRPTRPGPCSSPTSA